MEQPQPTVKPGFLLALLIVAVSLVFAVAAYANLMPFLGRMFGPISLAHWLSFTGAAFVGLYTPAFYVLKRRYKPRYQTFVRIHTFGNLLSILLISIHFGWNARFLGNIFLTTRTGLPLYATLLFMLITGINLRFQVSRRWLKLSRTIHTSFMTAFYLIVFFHILHGVIIP